MPVVNGGISGSSSSGAADGWTAASGWTYSSADAPTFVIATSTDQRALIGVGDRIKLNQTTDKYFIVTAIDGTTITVYGGTDYTLANAAIATPYYSHVKSPLGFPLSPAKWTVETLDTGDRAQASPVANTWYNLGSLGITVPIGVWRVYYQVMADTNRGSNGNVEQRVTLSTANNTQSDSAYTATTYNGPSAQRQMQTLYKEQLLTLAAKTAYFLNSMTTQATQTTIDFRGDVIPTTIRAVCVYL